MTKTIDGIEVKEGISILYKATRSRESGIYTVSSAEPKKPIFFNKFIPITKLNKQYLLKSASIISLTVKGNYQ